MAVKTNSQAIQNDKFLCMDGMNSDDFPVVDLFNLDFPEVETLFSREDEERMFFENDFHHFYSKTDEFDTLFPLKIDDVENWDWLSQFGLIYPADNGAVHNDIRFETGNIPVPKKARSKRSRPAGRAWYMVVPQDQKRKPENNGGPVSGWKCSHCQVQKTPQWRTGPLGPRTLCNACGVRFNSGRLYPEYRPACSPTFSHELHSNSHRKVLEMRRRRDEPGSL